MQLDVEWRTLDRVKLLIKLPFLLGNGEQWSPLLGDASSILASAGRGGTVAYTQARKSKSKGTRYVGYYLDADGRPKVAGTFGSDDEALRVAQE
jgi:hypothetical protein